MTDSPFNYPACHYCALREPDPSNTAEVRFGENKYVNYYCRKCLKPVIESMKDMPYVQQEGYIVEYPFKLNTNYLNI